MESPVEEVKKRIDIVDFIGAFISLKKTGRNFKALCPFHQEKTPSFIISAERQIWHCFGACGEGGDVIKFLMKWENLTFFEALKELADKVGIKLQKVSFEDKIWQKRQRFFQMNLLAGEFFQYVLTKTKFGIKALDYLKSREIQPPIIKTFQLGYAPASWRSLLRFLKNKKYEEEEMLENGLLVKNEKGGYYDRFRGRLMFPIKDTRGNVIGFSGRIIDQSSERGKYINTPETPIYHKRETLFGIHLAKESIKKEGNVFIVEGEFDTILPYQHGFSNFVAIKGSVLTREQLMLLKHYTGKITLTLDTDAAGEEAVKRGIEEAERLEFDIGVVNLDFAKDPDEAVRKDRLKFKSIIEKPLPIYDFIIDLAKKRYPEDNPFNKKKIGEEVIPFVERIRNNIVQSHYVKKLAELLNVNEASIYSLIKKLYSKKRQAIIFSSAKKNLSSISREFLLQRYILSFLFQSENPYQIAEVVFSILTPTDFTHISYQKICQLFLEIKKNHPQGFDFKQFMLKLPTELQSVFDEIYLFASTDPNLGNEKIDKLSCEIKKYALKRSIGGILSANYEEGDKKHQLSLLNKQLQEVEKRLISL